MLKMENKDNSPTLIACKKLKPEYDYLQQILIVNDNFSIGRGRGLKHSVVIPILSISRSHCTFKKCRNIWTLEDHSTYGIKINGIRIGRGRYGLLTNGDIITLEQTNEFVYKFVNPSEEVFEIPRKLMKLDSNITNENIINSVKMKFEESQNYEIQHIEEKIQNAKQMQTASMILKQQLTTDMNRKTQQLESEFATQIENLKGEKEEVERQKTLLLKEKDTQLTNIKQEMEHKIYQLMEQIKQCNESEDELQKENNLLMKEKLAKERVQFLTVLSHKNSCKEDLLNKLEKKIREQKNGQLKNRQDFLCMLQRVAEQILVAKEKELLEIEEQKGLKLDSIKNDVNSQTLLIEKDIANNELSLGQDSSYSNCLMGNWLIEQLKHLRSLNEKINESFNQQYTLLCQLDEEKAEIQKKIIETQRSYVVPYTLRNRKAKTIGTTKNPESLPFVPKRIQKQAEKSSEIISTLEKQLKEEENQRTTAQMERKAILDSFSVLTVLSKVRALIESELQCSICTELFVTPFTLNCGHTFCKYCISKWRKRNNTCPICRTSITSEVGCTVLNLVIMKMVQNFNEDMKVKRNETIENRKELEMKLLQQPENDDESFSSSYEGESYALELNNGVDSSDESMDSFSIGTSEPDATDEEFEELNFFREASDLDWTLFFSLGSFGSF